MLYFLKMRLEPLSDSKAPLGWPWPNRYVCRIYSPELREGGFCLIHTCKHVEISWTAATVHEQHQAEHWRDETWGRRSNSSINSVCYFIFPPDSLQNYKKTTKNQSRMWDRKKTNLTQPYLNSRDQQKQQQERRKPWITETSDVKLLHKITAREAERSVDIPAERTATTNTYSHILNNSRDKN